MKRTVTIYLAQALPLGSSGQPGDGPDAHGPSIWPCSRWGLAAGASPHAAGRSYRPISPLPARQRHDGGMFLCHFPSPARWPAPEPGRYPAPCPVEPGLSSPRQWPFLTIPRGGHPAGPAFSCCEASTGMWEGQATATWTAPSLLATLFAAGVSRRLVPFYV